MPTIFMPKGSFGFGIKMVGLKMGPLIPRFESYAARGA